MTIQEKVLNKLNKLLQHAKSAEDLNSPHEAKAFMGKVNELLMRHKLDLAQVKMHDEENLDSSIKSERFDSFEAGFGSMKRVAWQQRLSSTIARAHGCRILVCAGYNDVWFVGRERDRQISSYVFGTVTRAVIKYANKEYDRLYNKAYEVGNQHQMRGWKASFFRCFVTEVSNRYYEEEKAMEKEVGAETFALVITNQIVAVNKHVDEISTGRVEGMNGQRSGNSHGYDSGKQYGKSVNLSGTGITSNSSTKQLN